MHYQNLCCCVAFCWLKHAFHCHFPQLPQFFNPKLVLSQLRYSGMLETVRIRRAGYPVRRTYEDFLFRYILDWSTVISRSVIRPKITLGLYSHWMDITVYYSKASSPVRALSTEVNVLSFRTYGKCLPSEDFLDLNGNMIWWGRLISEELLRVSRRMSDFQVSVITYQAIAHFRVVFSLAIKARPGAQSFIFKWFNVR